MSSNYKEIILKFMNGEEEIKHVEYFKLVLRENLNTGYITTNMLQFAAAYGFLDECKILIAKGLDINEKNDLGWTPVMQAIGNDHYLLTKMLIDYGANVNLCNNYGINAVSLAVLRNNLTLLQLVSEASTNQESLKCALELSCLHGFTNIVQWLVSSTILNLNLLSTLTDLTPLMLATTGGHLDVVKLLLEYGADPLVSNSSNHSAFDIACYKNDLKIKSILHRNSYSSPLLISPAISTNSSSHFVFPTLNKLTFDPPNHVSKRHSTLVPLSPFTQTFNFDISTCYCSKPTLNTPACIRSPFPQDCHSSGSWCVSSWDSCTGHSDIAALVSPQLVKKYLDLETQTSLVKSISPKKGKKRKLFDKEWCSSWIKKLNKKRTKTYDDSNEPCSPTQLPIRSNSNDFSQLLFKLELEEYWPIFKEHELDIGVFFTLTGGDLDVMGIKDKQSQEIILNKIENLKRTQLI